MRKNDNSVHMSKICYTCTEAKSELQNRGKQKGYWLNNMEEIKLDCSVEIKPLKKIAHHKCQSGGLSHLSEAMSYQ